MKLLGTIKSSAVAATLTGCVCTVWLFSLLWIVFVLLLFYFIIIASIKYNDCPGKKGFSFIVLDLGIILFFQLLYECCIQCCDKLKPITVNGETIQNYICSARIYFRSLMFVWNIFMCVYVFTFHPDAQQCDPLLYYSLFAYCIMCLLCYSLIFIFVSSVLLIAWLFHRKSGPNTAENVV